MLALLKEWRLVLIVVIAVGAAWASWQVKGAFARAAEADRLESLNKIYKLQASWQQARLTQAESDRNKLAGELEAARVADKAAGETVVKVVKQYVRDDRACDIPVEVLRALNAQMGHEP